MTSVQVARCSGPDGPAGCDCRVQALRLQFCPSWGRSSAGRASRSQCEGRGFDPLRLHQVPRQGLATSRPFVLSDPRARSGHFEVGMTRSDHRQLHANSAATVFIGRSRRVGCRCSVMKPTTCIERYGFHVLRIQDHGHRRDLGGSRQAAMQSAMDGRRRASMPCAGSGPRPGGRTASPAVGGRRGSIFTSAVGCRSAAMLRGGRREARRAPRPTAASSRYTGMARHASAHPDGLDLAEACRAGSLPQASRCVVAPCQGRDERQGANRLRPSTDRSAAGSSSAATARRRVGRPRREQSA